ncbi:zinc dependent phospholipase C family protein [Paenibacillus pabuli]|uniref:zinc dependent phospholipase C family protein n=1 Tax=Paenibacillus pabuli TaxID=1472 RepID=UPI0007809293|nr:zinc dependent phospholipase C family protein [Paenibacillus pabuli]MEC0128480.1 zinc dependent phospholipase C family protein [Paenibacillus pabuli]
MPGPITHLIVQQKLATYLHEMRRPDLAKMLRDQPCSPYTGFGSIGPDFLFFSMKEYGPDFANLINTYFEIYETLQPFIDFYEKHVKPMEEKIDEGINWIDEKLFHGLLQQLRDVVSTIISGALHKLASVLTDKVDLFYAVYPKVQKGAPENDWYWFDTLHYRKSGTFCSNMWKLAKDDEDLKRYCLGYASHIGTDIVGHPFVNTIVGGPYRTHWHRHKLVENWIDAYMLNDDAKMQRQTFRDCNLSSGEERFSFNSISGSYLYKSCQFEDDKLPKKLGEMFISSLNITFKDIPHPPMLSLEDLDSTYRLWLSWFKKATESGLAVKPKPVDPPGGASKELWVDFIKGLPRFPKDLSGRGGRRISIRDFFRSMQSFLEYLKDVALYVVDWTISHIGDIVTLGYWEGIQLLKYLLYQIHKVMYDFYDNCRFSLVVAGYLFPESEDLTKHPWGLCFVNTSFAHLTGGGVADFSKYPLKQEHHGFSTPEDHLIYPQTFAEEPFAEPAPRPFYGKFPTYFVYEAQKSWSDQIERLYDCTIPYGENDSTHSIDHLTWENGQLGNALQCSADLIVSRMEDLPNFNLDGDRGYGWKTWSTNVSGPLDDINPLDVNYNN